MAIRAVFSCGSSLEQPVLQHPVSFKWHPGLTTTQKQKSIAELHTAFTKRTGISTILEISTKSPLSEGRALSAFRVRSVMACGFSAPLECIYQGAKVFEFGGPFKDCHSLSPNEARKLTTNSDLGELQGFSFQGESWPADGTSIFYDWLYCNAVLGNPDLVSIVESFDAFSDIEFNPKRSVACQARSAALLKCALNLEISEDELRDSKKFRDLFSHTGQKYRESNRNPITSQISLVLGRK